MHEDNLVQSALQKLNITCQRVAWDSDFEASNFEFALSELELIEPEMWFRLNKPGVDRMAIAIRDFICREQN